MKKLVVLLLKLNFCSCRPSPAWKRCTNKKHELSVMHSKEREAGGKGQRSGPTYVLSLGTVHPISARWVNKQIEH